MQRMQDAEDFSFDFKHFLTPLTTRKAICWIVIIGVIVYANMLFNGFVWDDNFQIVTNPVVTGGQFFYYFTHTWGGFFRPLMFMIWTFLYQLFHYNTFFYHLPQLLLHITNAFFIFLLFNYFLRRSTASLVLALIFLVHPINEETVAYIANLQDMLFVFFGLAALVLLLKRSTHLSTFLLVSFLLLCSLLSKETGIVFFFVLPLFLWLCKRERRATIWLLLSEAVSTIIYLLLRYLFGSFVSYLEVFWPIDRLNLHQRLINVPSIILYYIQAFFIPLRLAIDRISVISTIDIQNFYLPFAIDVLFFVLLTGGYLYLRRKKSDLAVAYLFFFIWFALGLLFHLQLIPLEMTVANRWFYFPFVGLLGMLAIGVIEIPTYTKPVVHFAQICLCILILLLAVRTITRNTNWQNGVTLFAHAIQDENNFDAENNYGAALSLEGDNQTAIKAFTESIALSPYEANLRNLGSAYLDAGYPKKAIGYFSKAYLAQTYNMDYPHKRNLDTYQELALSSYLYGSASEARQIAINGLMDYPNTQSFYLIEALSEYKIGEKRLALNASEKAYELMPNQQTTYVYHQISNNLPIKISVSH